MTDTTLIDHERRLTSVQKDFAIIVTDYERRLGALEAAEAQRQQDAIQAEHRANADLMKRLADAEAKLAAQDKA